MTWLVAANDFMKGYIYSYTFPMKRKTIKKNHHFFK